VDIEAKVKKRLKTISRRDAVCTVSGGLDSAVAAAIMAKLGFNLHFIFFDWGQKTYEKELKCTKALAKYFNATLKIVEVPILKSLPDISLTQKETLTTAINEYVPNRNAILESQAVAYAEYLKAGDVCIGSTGGDHICPDNSPKFVEIMQRLVDEGTLLKPPIQLIAPLVHTDKIGAVKIGYELGVPFELTWSCHNNTDLACGYCSNCKSRLEAFRLNGKKDPIEYEK
jgi:7-cyano-7-deazaguanine synthase